MNFDLLITGGMVYDGEGGEPVRADVGVRGDRIALVGQHDGAPAGVVIDATNRAVTPGFVDVHSHDDISALVEPTMDFKILQGVTSEIVGNCGMGAAPYEPALHMFTPWTPGLAYVPPWDGYRGYLERLDAEPASVNIAALVAHGNVRVQVMGNEHRAPTANELAAMEALVAEGIEGGAIGLSTGLIYQPGCYADTDEIVALAALVARSGGIYTTHMRNEADLLLDAVTEAIAIGERAGLPVEISHHKASGRANWGKVTESLAMIDAACAAGGA